MFSASEISLMTRIDGWCRPRSIWLRYGFDSRVFSASWRSERLASFRRRRMNSPSASIWVSHGSFTLAPRRLLRPCCPGAVLSGGVLSGGVLSGGRAVRGRAVREAPSGRAPSGACRLATSCCLGGARRGRRIFRQPRPWPVWVRQTGPRLLLSRRLGAGLPGARLAAGGAGAIVLAGGLGLRAIAVLGAVVLRLAMLGLAMLGGALPGLAVLMIGVLADRGGHRRGLLGGLANLAEDCGGLVRQRGGDAADLLDDLALNGQQLSGDVMGLGLLRQWGGDAADLLDDLALNSQQLLGELMRADPQLLGARQHRYQLRRLLADLSGRRQP